MKAFFLSLLSFTILSVQAQQASVKVQLHAIEGYGNHEEFARKAITALEEVFNSQEFKEAVLSGEYKKTNGLTNEALYDKIMLAKEVQGPGGQDAVVDLRVRTLRITADESKWRKNCEIGSRAGTIGIDGNGDGVTAICPQRLEKWSKEDDVANLAGHYAHEYMHIIGFNHYRLISWDSWRQKTFVYKIGNLVADLINDKKASS